MGYVNLEKEQALKKCGILTRMPGFSGGVVTALHMPGKTLMEHGRTYGDCVEELYHHIANDQKYLSPTNAPGIDRGGKTSRKPIEPQEQVRRLASSAKFHASHCLDALDKLCKELEKSR